MIDSDYRSQRNEKEWWLVTFHLHVLEIGLWWPSFCCLNLLQKSRNVVIIWRPICVFWICISGSISLVIILIFMASWKFALQYIFNKAQQLKRKIQGFQWPCQTIQWDWDNNFIILFEYFWHNSERFQEGCYGIRHDSSRGINALLDSVVV